MQTARENHEDSHQDPEQRDDASGEGKAEAPDKRGGAGEIEIDVHDESEQYSRKPARPGSDDAGGA